MLYTDFTVGNQTYKLRLNTRGIVMLEKTLGSNPLNIFGNDLDNPTMPTITSLVSILYVSLQQYQHGIDMNKAYDIFDDYIAEGHIPFDFISVVMDIFKVSGIIPKDKEEAEVKNA